MKFFSKDPNQDSNAAEEHSWVLEKLENWMRGTCLHTGFLSAVCLMDVRGSSSYMITTLSSQHSSLPQALVGCSDQLKELPSLLTIPINRSTFKQGTLKVERNLDTFTYPSVLSGEILDRISPGAHTPNYELYAVVVCCIKEKTPHYTVFVKTQEGWIFYEDATVCGVEEETVLSAA